jgi:protein tyrosine phosphatase (PTP) superfamily phosphohydrolase (DUF442 family)
VSDSANEAALLSIYNYLRLSERVATAGQPRAEQFPAIAAAGFQVVINLLPVPAEGIPNEAELARELGMEYVSIPVVWKQPTAENFAAFVAAMQTHAQKRVFVHCAANMRVSAFMYLYRTLYERVPPETAAADLHRIWVPNAVWKPFIEEIVARCP